MEKIEKRWYILGLVVLFSILFDVFLWKQIAVLDQQRRSAADSLAGTQAQLKQSLEKRQNTMHTNLLKLSQFIDRVEISLAEPEEPGKVMAYVMMDGDHMNQMNAAYGYDRITKVIQDFAVVLKDTFPDADNDILCNIGDGSDEFCLLLKNRKSKEEVEAQVAALLDHWRSHEALYDGVPVKVTFSAGIAFRNGEDKDIFALYKRADRALYKAKNNGRDQYQVE